MSKMVIPSPTIDYNEIIHRAIESYQNLEAVGFNGFGIKYRLPNIDVDIIKVRESHYLNEGVYCIKVKGIKMSVFCNLEYDRKNYKTVTRFTEEKLDNAILSATILNSNTELESILNMKSDLICNIFEAVAVTESRYNALLYGRPLVVEIVVDQI